MKKIISIVTPTYNEEENIERMVKEIEKVMDSMKDKYEYEHVVIDNNSKDKTVEILKKIASDKKNLKVIGVNYRDNPEKTIKWLKDLGNPYKDILIDRNGKIAIDWGVYGIPETFIINSNGIIKYRHVGPITNKIYKKINLIIKQNE